MLQPGHVRDSARGSQCMSAWGWGGRMIMVVILSLVWVCFPTPITMATAFPSPPSLCVSLSCSERSSRDRHKPHSRDSSSRSDKNVTISASSAQPQQPDQGSAPTDAQVSQTLNRFEGHWCRFTKSPGELNLWVPWIKHLLWKHSVQTDED